MSEESRIRLTVLLAGARPDIVEANLLVSSEATPGLDVDAYLGRVDAMAVDAATRGGDADAVLATMRDAGLAPPDGDYDDPQNSFVDRVLDRGHGIPIALSAIALGVARRAGAPLAGIGLPGHFVLADTSGPEPRYIDPFGWREIDRDECARLALTTAGADVGEEDLQPVGPRAMLARMIANLRGSYLARRSLRDVLWCVDLSLILAPGEPSLIRERVTLLAGTGRYDDAEGEARAHLARVPDSPEREALERQITAVQEMRRSMN